MARPELGNKYTCHACGTKFYDLNRAHFTCPTCGFDPRSEETEAVMDEQQDEEIFGVNSEEPVEDAETVKDDEDDEDDLDVEEIDMDDASAESRLMELSGSDDDDDAIGLKADGIDDDEDMEVGDLEDVSFVSGGDDEDSSGSDDSDD